MPAMNAAIFESGRNSGNMAKAPGIFEISSLRLKKLSGNEVTAREEIAEKRIMIHISFIFFLFSRNMAAGIEQGKIPADNPAAANIIPQFLLI